jgi:hypothetical protein
MPVFTYHLIRLSFFSAFRRMLFPVKAKKVVGLVHAETMSAMTLGSPIYSVSRFFNRDVIVFAQWKNEAVFDEFIHNDSFGKMLSKGWFTKLEFIRQWGKISGFEIPKNREEELNDDQPVVAVTIARMKYAQIPRFLRWGRPVEKLVRDHPGTTLSLASIRYPNTISTFSIWKTQKEMTDMVKGHSQVPQPKRHIDAMEERTRKDFHFEFTTLRFKPLSESGEWKDKSQFIPKS